MTKTEQEKALDFYNRFIEAQKNEKVDFEQFLYREIKVLAEIGVKETMKEELGMYFLMTGEVDMIESFKKGGMKFFLLPNEVDITAQVEGFEVEITGSQEWNDTIEEYLDDELDDLREAFESMNIVDAVRYNFEKDKVGVEAQLTIDEVKIFI